MSRERCFVFCHGFGFNTDYWNPLRSYFSTTNTVYMDLGYFTNEVNISPNVYDYDYIGIGHSLGLIKLISSTIPFKALIGLHGFVNFLGYNPALSRRRTRELTHLSKQFNDAPVLTLQQFYQRTGVDFMLPSMDGLHQQRLLDDLTSLFYAVPVPQTIPMLILGSCDDIIVPWALIEDNFSHHPHVNIELLHHVQHGLGYLRPDLVYQKIMRFLE